MYNFRIRTFHRFSNKHVPADFFPYVGICTARRRKLYPAYAASMTATSTMLKRERLCVPVFASSSKPASSAAPKISSFFDGLARLAFKRGSPPGGLGLHHPGNLGYTMQGNDPPCQKNKGWRTVCKEPSKKSMTIEIAFHFVQVFSQFATKLIEESPSRHEVLGAKNIKLRSLLRPVCPCNLGAKQI